MQLEAFQALFNLEIEYFLDHSLYHHVECCIVLFSLTENNGRLVFRAISV